MQPQPLDQDVVNLTKAIRKHESNDNYTVRSKDGSFGAYQFIKPTWDATSKKYGVNAEWDQATPEQQNKVAYHQVKEWKDKGYNVGQIASMWNAGAGRPNAYKENLRGTNSAGVNYDTPAYAKRVAETYQSFKATTKPAQAVGANIAQTQQPAQALGGSNPVQNVWQGGPAFPSQQDDSVGESLLKTAGNLPGAVFNLGRNLIAPVNPFDYKHPLSIGGNLQKYGSQGVVEGTKAAGRDLGQVVQAVDDKASGAFRMVQERGLGPALAEGGGRLAETLINDPTIVPSLLAPLPRKFTGGRDLISDVASPVTKPAAKVGAVLDERSDNKSISSREQALLEVDEKYSDRRASMAASPDNWTETRQRAARSNVLTDEGVINEDGNIVGARKASENYESQAIGEGNKAVRTLLEREQESVSIDEIRAEMKQIITDSFEGSELITNLKKMEREIAGLRYKNPNRRLMLYDVHDLKIKARPRGKDYEDPEKSRYKKQISRTYKEVVEKRSSENVRAINAELQKLYDTREYIAGLQGKRIDSGKLGKAVARAGGAVAGAVVGGALGGIPGVIAGSYAGGVAYNKLAGRAMSKKFGKPTKKSRSLKNPIIEDVIARSKADRKQLALPAPRPKKPLALPAGTTTQKGPNIPLRPAKSVEKGVEKPPYLDSLDLQNLKRMAEEPLSIPDELKKYLNLDEGEIVAIKSKNDLPDELEGKLVALQIAQEALDNHPAKALSKFTAKRGDFKGQLAEQGQTKGGMGIDERISESTSGAYDTVEEARAGYIDYIKNKEQVAKAAKALAAEVKAYKARELKR